MLGIPTVLMGFALPDDRMHAPNEKFHLPNFFKGIATSIRFLWPRSGQRNQIDLRDCSARMLLPSARLHDGGIPL